MLWFARFTLHQVFSRLTDPAGNRHRMQHRPIPENNLKVEYIGADPPCGPRPALNLQRLNERT
jgi:hypothetical protein